MSLYLGALHFDGEPGELLRAYHRLLERFPLETLDLHLCVAGDRGITVLDACPSREIYDAFTHGDAFLGAVSAAGLPSPRIERLGEVHVAHVREEVRP